MDALVQGIGIAFLKVGENLLGILQPTLSQQLGVLRGEGIVNTRRQGKNIFYSVADPAALEILALLYRLYCPQGEA